MKIWISIGVGLTLVGALCVLRLFAIRPVDANLKPQPLPAVVAYSENETKETESGCQPRGKSIQAEDVIEEFDELSYRGYGVQRRHKLVRIDVARRYGPSPNPVDVSYFVVTRNGRQIEKFDSGVYSPLGDRAAAGMFALINNQTEQLVVSQDTFRTGVQWVADFSNGFSKIFDGRKFHVGREATDMTISDLDGDGISELTVPITAFYGFQRWRLTTSETPLPRIIFKFDPAKREYLPANRLFSECLLQDIVESDRKLRDANEPPRLGDVMSVVLDYVFIGEESHAWELFEELCNLPDKTAIKEDMKHELRSHPVYRHLQSTLAAERRQSGIRQVDFGNLTYPAEPIYGRGGFKLTNGRYKGRPGIPGAGYPYGENYPVSLAAVAYGDVTGDDKEEAMVVLGESVAGTAAPHYMYVYSFKNKRAKLLWAVAAGDRAEGGLRKIYSEKSELVIELYGREARVNGNVFGVDSKGACCPRFVTRTRYRWNRSRFVQNGKSEVFPIEENGAALEMQ